MDATGKDQNEACQSTLSRHSLYCDIIVFVKEVIYILTKNAKAIIATLIGVGIVGGLTSQAVMVNQQVQQLKKAVYEKPMVIVATPSASLSATLNPTQGVKVFKYSPLPSKGIIVK